MNKRLVTRDQRNEIYDAVVQAELNPKEFRWEERPSSMTSKVLVSAIVHIPSGHYFVFDYSFQSIQQYRVECSPGEHSSPEIHEFAMEEERMYRALDWVSRLKKELETPDMWDELAQQKRLVVRSTSADAENTPFSADEKKLITASLERVLEEVASTSVLVEDERSFIEERFNYLKEASERFGRKDWIMLAFGVFGIISAYLLAPEASRNLFKSLTELIREIANVKYFLP